MKKKNLKRNSMIKQGKMIIRTSVLSSVLIVSSVISAFAGTSITDTNLNVRKEPSLKGKIVETVPKGTKLETIEDVDGGWTKINFNDQTCYVKTEYLSPAPTAKTAEIGTAGSSGSAAEPDTGATGSTSAGTANAASDASAASDTSTGSTSAASSTVTLNPSWKYADYSAINSGAATLYKATANRKNKVIGVNAGHGTKGGASVKTYCHPDKTAKVTGGSTAKGATQATAVSSGMSFNDGTAEAKVTLREAQILRDLLLSKGYDVLMIRDGDDVQLDNVARTVICNNAADCHIAIHWDGDGLSYDKGCFYCSVPDGIKYLETVAATWEKSEKLGDSLIKGLAAGGSKINGAGSTDIDLTQTSYSTVPSVDIELGNQCSDHSDATLTKLANGLASGIDAYFGFAN